MTTRIAKRLRDRLDCRNIHIDVSEAAPCRPFMLLKVCFRWCQEVSPSAVLCNLFDPALAPEYVLRKCNVGTVKTCQTHL
jgi:hypothetical protein